MKPFSSEADKQERRDLISFLRQTSPSLIADMATDGVLKAFHRAAARVPAYRELLGDAAVDQVDSVEAFSRIAPVLDKYNTFNRFSIDQLCLDGNLEGVRSLLTSSGHSGVFCFGVNTADNLARSSKSIDMGLQYIFNVDEKSTLLINALPMGVKVNTKSTVLAETSVRDDMVYALVKKFAADFDQIVLVGEGSFLKKIIEDGHEYHGIDWKALRVHLITGEEGIAENYRSYIGSLIGADLDDSGGKIIMSSMGVAELDLNIFHETQATVRIRRLAHADPRLRTALFGDVDVCPMLFVYYPHRCYVEELPASGDYQELVVSMLSEEMKIPLLRYRSGDFGKIFSYEQMVDTMSRCGYAIEPDLKLPFVGVSGRGKSLATTQGELFPEAVKEAMYANFQIAASVTGNFRLSKQGDDAESETAKIEFQLRPGKELPSDGIDTFLYHLKKFSPVKPQILFHPYESCPFGMELDFERKFRYL